MISEERYYDSEEFKEILHTYEDALNKGENVFMDADDLIDIAEYYNSENEIEKCYETAEYAVSLFPDAAVPLAYMAHLCAALMHDTAKALSILSQIEDKTHPDYFNTMAEIMLLEERDEEAEQYLQEYYDMQSGEEERDDFAIDAALLYSNFMLYQQADEWLKRVASTESLDYKELKARIDIFHEDYDEAERIFNEILDEDPYCGTYWNHLASLQYLRQDYQGAIHSSEYALAINPEDEEACLNKANGLFAMHNYEEALKYYMRFSNMFPDDFAGKLYTGICLLNLEKMTEGIQYLKEADLLVEKDSEDAFRTQHELTIALMQQGFHEEALRYTDKMEANPFGEKAETYVVRAHILMSMLRTDEALRYYAKAIETSSDKAHIFLRIAISLYDLSMYSQAYKMFLESRLHTIGKQTEGYAYEALCCFQLGKEEEFREAVRLACENNPKEAEIVLSELFPQEVAPSDYYKYLMARNHPFLKDTKH